MNTYISVIVSVFLFLVGLVLFKAIFPALGLTLFFLLIWSLFEAVWHFRESPVILGIVNLFFAAILALVVYSLVFLPVEFLLTEILLITPRLPHFFNTLFLLVLVVVLSPVKWHRFLTKKSWRWSIISLLIVSGLVYGFWRHYKLAREYLPKIYQISPNFGIQAQIVEIKGVNFWPVWKRGKIVLGGQEMVIKDWNEELIKAEQPVPGKFGQVELWVERNDGIKSNKVRFEIRDPGELKH